MNWEQDYKNDNEDYANIQDNDWRDVGKKDEESKVDISSLENEVQVEEIKEVKEETEASDVDIAVKVVEEAQPEEEDVAANAENEEKEAIAKEDERSLEEMLRETIAGYEDEKQTKQEEIKNNVDLEELTSEGEEEAPKEKFSMADAKDRVGHTEEKNEFELVDKGGQPVVYEDGEEQAGAILVKEGSEVVKLEPQAGNPDLTGVVLWVNGKYREGFLETKAFGGGVSEDNEFATEVFVNDAEHIVARAKQKINQAGKEGEAWLIPQFEALVTEVETDLAAYKNGSLTIDNELLKQIQAEDMQFMEMMVDEPIKATSIMETDIKAAYDPKDELGQKLSEKTLFSPLNQDWFESDDDLEEYATAKYKNKPASIVKKNQNFEGSKAKKMKATLMKLKKFAKKEDLPETKETEWLKELKSSDLKDVATVVVNRKKKVDSKTKRDKYVADSIGPVEAKSMMTDALHQMNNQAEAGQTELVQKYWEMANQGNFEQVKFAMEENGQIGLDALFQLNSTVGLVYLKHLLQRIKAKGEQA